MEPPTPYHKKLQHFTTTKGKATDEKQHALGNYVYAEKFMNVSDSIPLDGTFAQTFVYKKTGKKVSHR